MTGKKFNQNLAVLSAGIAATAGLRVLMASYPNIEPVMVSTIVFGLACGPVAGFAVGFLSMVLSNVFLGATPLEFPWLLAMPLVTVYTSLTYGLIGLAAGFLSVWKKKWGRTDYAVFAGIATVFYDFVTAVCFGLQFFGPAGVYGSLVAQVPFTVMHLSNVVLAFVFAPYLYKGVVGLKEATYKGFPAVFGTD